MDNKLINALSKKEIFIFDFDGTIASTDKFVYGASRRVLAQDGIDFTLDDYASFFGKDAFEYCNIINELFKTNYTFEDFAKRFLTEYHKIEIELESQPYNYILDLIKSLPNKRKVILSNALENAISPLLEKWEILDNFENIYSCANLNIKKSQFYADTRKYFNVEQKDCVVFEDTQRYLDEAAKLGIMTVGIEHTDRNNKISADYIIKVNE